MTEKVCKFSPTVIDGYAKVATKYSQYLWRGLAPGGHNFNKLKTGLLNTFTDKKVLDWADRPVELYSAVLSTIFGVKLTPANVKKLRSFENYQMHRIGEEVRKEMYRLKMQEQKGQIDEEDFRKQIKALQELRKELLPGR